MGIRQNLRLWENRVTYIDEDGVVTSAIRPRQLPPAPWKLIGLLTWKNWMYFLVGL
jgi:SHS family lactate transporter-like MFS transporter